MQNLRYIRPDFEVVLHSIFFNSDKLKFSLPLSENEPWIFATTVRNLSKISSQVLELFSAFFYKFEIGKLQDLLLIQRFGH